MTPQEFGRSCDTLTDAVGMVVATFAMAVAGWWVTRNLWLLVYHAWHGDRRWHVCGRALLETSLAVAAFITALDLVDANAARELEESD